MFTALQLLGLGLLVAGGVVVAGLGGLLIGLGVSALSVGLAGEG